MAGGFLTFATTSTSGFSLRRISSCGKKTSLPTGHRSRLPVAGSSSGRGVGTGAAKGRGTVTSVDGSGPGRTVTMAAGGTGGRTGVRR